MLYNKQKDTAQ